jgi:uncharacterized membrane protein
MKWFWIGLIYSFGGYLLEKGYAAAIHSRHRVRKCFLLLPLCPVYGLAMVAILHLPPDLTDRFLSLALYGGLTATAVEFLTHLGYEKLLGVMFWDYGPTKMDVDRRICLPFSVIWGLLTALAVRYLHPWVEDIAVQIPPSVTYAALLLVIADSFFSVRLLYQRHDIDLLGLPNLVRELRQE